MTIKEKTDIINTARAIVIAELKAVNAHIFVIEDVEYTSDTNRIKRITEREITNIVEVFQYARIRVEKMPVTERTVEAIKKIQQCGIWYCQKFNLSYRYMD